MSFVTFLKIIGRSPDMIRPWFISSLWEVLGGTMDFITNLFSNVNFELIAQLLMLSLIVIAGPVVIVLLAFRGGDL
ncbi:photosystem II reaction center protein Ycf12/Psb30 [Limnospira fusiformis]|uniref:photosystem II reaction center protein Ycf12/Psb30 n=1 Tax=Limnospira TaxID=2596745 RepID=UPI003D6BB17C